MRRCLTRRAPSPYRTPVRRRGPALLVIVRSWRGARCWILVSRMVSVGRRRDLLTATKSTRMAAVSAKPSPATSTVSCSLSSASWPEISSFSSATVLMSTSPDSVITGPASLADMCTERAHSTLASALHISTIRSAKPDHVRYERCPTASRGRARRTRQTIWMQTTGASLLTVKRCSLSRVWATAQDGHSTHGLLYLAAVLNDSCQPKTPSRSG
jgi:hypothetical protein